MMKDRWLCLDVTNKKTSARKLMLLGKSDNYDPERVEPQHIYLSLQ